MGLMDLYRDYDITLNDCLLKHTTSDINDFQIKEVTESLDYAYNSKDPNQTKIATLMNAIFTHHAQTFMLTRRSFGELIKNDENSSYKSINGMEYKLILRLMLSNKHFDCLRKPAGRKAGVYKAIHPDLVSALHKLHSKEWFDLQEQKVCGYYDDKESTFEEEESVGDRMRKSLRAKGFKLKD